MTTEVSLSTLASIYSNFLFKLFCQDHVDQTATYSPPAGGGARCLSEETHQYVLTNFNAPTKCAYCTSLMIGMERQGVICHSTYTWQGLAFQRLNS